MNQVKCPNCGEVFTIDENSYASIVEQIRNEEFASELDRRTKAISEKTKMEAELLKKQFENEKSSAVSIKEKEIENLKHEKELLESKYDAKLAEELSKREEANRNNEVKANAALLDLQQQISQLKMELKVANSEKESALKAAEEAKARELSEALADSKIEIAELKNTIKAMSEKAKADLAAAAEKSESEKSVLLSELKNKDAEKDLAVSKAVTEVKDAKDAEVAKANQKYELLKIEAETKAEAMKNSYEEKLAGKDRIIAEKQEQVDYYKDFKTKMSTKMIGETLEQHCLTEFNRNRMGMFPKAYFEKDNEVVDGTKADFVYRDYDEDGTEILSIVFEMKNEADTTATKHKNEDFLDKLDKDRAKKGCEYAVLVSLLETDSELYNGGIVDVSYRYPKMYVIRPQFFIPLISLLKNAAMNAVGYKRQLMIERNNNLDVTHFEENMLAFKDAFSKNYLSAATHFESAIKEIDKSIANLEKIKKELTTSENQLRLANNKAQDLSIKRLTKNAPSVALKFEEARNK